ncbi:MAG: hypothetical protein ACRDD4_11380 [Culicoidibacterales bacterium]
MLRMVCNMSHKQRNLNIFLIGIGIVLALTGILIVNAINQNIQAEKKQNNLQTNLPVVKIGESFYDNRTELKYIVDEVEVLPETTNFHFKIIMPNYGGYHFRGIRSDNSLSEYKMILAMRAEKIISQSCEQRCEKYERYVLVNHRGEQVVILDTAE